MLYRSYLSAELKKQGYEIIPGKKGTFEIANVPTELIKEFSRRRDQIVTALDGRESGGALAEKLALMTRDAKPHYVDQAALRQEWRERASALGYSVEKIQQMTLQAENKMDKGLPAIDHLKETIKSLENQKSVWIKEEMIFPVLRSGIADGITYEKAEKLIEEAVGRKELVLLQEGRYSTLEAIRIEKRIIELVQEQKETASPINLKQIEAVIKDHGNHLNQDQINAVRFITQSLDGMTGLQGTAGTGKTFTLSNVRAIFEKSGFNVHGLSFTGKAAEGLEEGAGIKSQTLSSFLIEKEAIVKGSVNNRQVYIVDEASMVGNKQMLSLLEMAKAENAKVVLVGDVKQLQAISAGSPFAMLQEKGILPTVTMSEVIRQKNNEQLKEVVNAIAKEKDTDKAINLLEKMGAIREIESREERLAAIAKDFLSLTPKEMRNTIILTARNLDRRHIVGHIREGLKEKGILNSETEKAFTVAIPKSLQENEIKRGESYAAGDLIRFGRAYQTLEVGKGELGTVKDIHGNILTIRMDLSGKDLLLDLNKYHRIEVYSQEQRNFTHGDQVMFLKNNKELGVVNGSTGMVVGVGEQSLKIETRSGVKEIDFSQNRQSLDYSLGLTVHKAQGVTSERVLANFDMTQKSSLSANSFYVSVSRAASHFTAYVSSRSEFPDAVRYFESKEVAIDYLKDKNLGFENGKEVNRQPEKSYERSLSF